MCLQSSITAGVYMLRLEFPLLMKTVGIENGTAPVLLKCRRCDCDEGRQAEKPKALAQRRIALVE